MPFISYDFEDVKEMGPAPAGKYDLQIVECVERKAGPNAGHPGDPQLLVTAAFTGHDDYNTVQHYISLPGGADPTKDKGKALFLMRFLEAFSIQYSKNGIDTEELCMTAPGHSANLEVSLSTPDDQGRVYNRLVLPRLKQ